MTFKTTVKSSKDGAPIEGVLVTANDENTGESYSRTTDGAGYADVAMLGNTKPGNRVTFSVLDPQMRFKGDVKGDALVIGTEDQVIDVVLDPFV